jgi:hypothetical protein
MRDLKCAPGMVFLGRRRCLRARSGRSSLFVLLAGGFSVVALALLAGASRELGVGAVEKLVDQSALAQTPCCDSTGGLSIDPIASAIPGTLVLESEGWRISNTDADPLVIKHVTINGEHAAPIGCGACGHIKPAFDRHYPVTVESGKSVRIFGYAYGDYRSYRKTVKNLVIETDRGTFHYSATAGVEAE